MQTCLHTKYPYTLFFLLKMTIKANYIFILCVILWTSNACKKQESEQETSNINHVDRQTEEDFEIFYTQFIEDFNLKNTRHLNRCIEVDNGLVVIASEGIYGIPHKFSTFAEFMEYNVAESEINFIQNAKIATRLRYGAKPIFDCVTQKWSQEGCFWNDKPNPQFSGLYDVLMEHKIIAHDQTVEEQIKTIDALATRIVYDTEQNIGFYFTRMNGKWYLLCIERILPCGK